MTLDVASISRSNRVVLLAVAALDLDDETPAHAPGVREQCRTHAQRLEDVVVGKFDEATVARSLNELEATGHLETVDPSETTAVGKGRPAYQLVDPPSAVLDSLCADDALEPAVDTLRDRT